ncbi:ATP-binding protein [Paracnuella aquatica]|uniref:ATP-binding protein n=1 Tax=Paracnuella aquatica TaxID=2268757 RepID=UPI000DEF74A8|nr:ATP-binding protein [Paracnuella aquatica]RPD44481.1 ATP-binding protein [Paracnuella aquatica]
MSTVIKSMEVGILQHITLNVPGISINEKNIISLLAKVFKVTFVKATVFKNYHYVYGFLKPTSELQEKYRLQNEILVLISDNEHFDGRSFDYVDKLLFEFQNRLDKLCVLFVSKDKKLKEKVRTHVQHNAESRIVIPFSYLDFLKGDAKQTILHRLKEFFYGRDLFAFESPLQNDTYFFGRNEVVQFFYDKFKTGENSGLFGLRKIGKTSVLFALRRYLAFRNEIPIFLDCQEPSFHLRRWFDALEYVIRNTVQYLKSDLQIDIEVSSDSYSDLNASERFQNDLLHINSQIDQKRILIIFDEIESITFGISPSQHWFEGGDFIYFWQAIRAIYQKRPNLFSFIIAGVNPKAIETSVINGFDNPIYRMITATYLKFFDTKSTKDMVSGIGNYMGMNFDEEIYTYLSEDYGGHPFLIRQVCSKMHQQLSKNRPVQVSRYMYKENKELYDIHLRDYIELMIGILQKWYPSEYELIELLAIEDLKTFEERVSGFDKMVEHLIGYNLIEKSDTRYHIKIEAIKKYLLEKTKLLKVNLPIEDKWKLVAEKRNVLELDLRKAVKMLIKANYGALKGKERFLSTVEENRRNRLNAFDLHGIFNEGEIYLNDLKTYILKNWDDFNKVFPDRNYFELSMQMINRYRIDAHAKDISHEQMVQLLSCINELQSRISSFLE